MENIEIKPKLHPIVASLPKHLKDPANFEKIQKLVIKSLQGKCSHAEVVEWAQCGDCQARFQQRRGLLKKLGFKNSAQYMAWKKIHTTISEMQKVKLPKYNSPI